MHLIEPEGKERSGSLFLGAGSLVSNKSTVILALQNFHTGAGKGLSCAPSLWALSFTGVQAAWRSARPLAMRMFGSLELHRQRTRLKVSSKDSEFICRLVGGSFKQKFARYFCYFGSCPHNTFY